MQSAKHFIHDCMIPGGAQDVENFRENIRGGYLPLPTDITYGGIVKSYYFDTSPRSGLRALSELCTCIVLQSCIFIIGIMIPNDVM